jgi:hypothetical protein
MQNQIDRRLPNDPTPIDFDPSLGWIDFRAELRDHVPVDADPASLDEAFGKPTRANPSAC